jgi:enamidase
MFVFTNGILIDGTGRQPVKKATIVVKGNRIASVDWQGEYPEKATVVDLKGLVIMPGLIECHTHFGGVVDLKPGQVPFMNMESSHSYAFARKSSIENGVTSLRSVGDYFPDIIKLGDQIEAGKFYGPRVFSTGPLFTAPNGHPAGTIYKGNPSLIEHCTRQVESVNSARDEVKKLAEGGVDYIKAILCSLDYWNYPSKVPKLSMSVLNAITDEAHKHNLRVVVHAETPKDAMNAVSMGVDTIEHLIAPGAESTEVPDALIKMMIDNGTYFVPTLTISWVFEHFIPQLPKLLSILMPTVKRLYEAGVTIATGTDSGAPGVMFGSAIHQEMELMVESGLSPMAAIVAATRKAAETLGHEKEIGTIEEGKFADIVIVSGNPVARITDTKNIKLVMKDGKILADKLGILKDSENLFA